MGLCIVIQPNDKEGGVLQFCLTISQLGRVAELKFVATGGRGTFFQAKTMQYSLFFLSNLRTISLISFTDGENLGTYCENFRT